MEKCGTCKWTLPVKENLLQRLCCGLPPTPCAVPAPGGIQLMMVRPSVEISQEGCSLHQPKIIPLVK